MNRGHEEVCLHTHPSSQPTVSPAHYRLEIGIPSQSVPRREQDLEDQILMKNVGGKLAYLLSRRLPDTLPRRSGYDSVGGRHREAA